MIRRSLLLALACTTLLPAAARADVRVDQTPPSVKPGGPVSVSVTVSAESSCSLTAAGVARAAGAAGQERITFTFRAARTARPGRYTVTVRCGKRTAKTSVRVRAVKRTAAKKKPRYSRRPFVGPVGVSTRPAPPSGATTTTPGKASPTAPQSLNPYGPPPTANTPQTLPVVPVQNYEAAADTYMQQRLDAMRDTGQCTGWMAVKAEAIVRYVDRQRILTSLQRGDGPAAQPLLTTSDAKDWGRIARESGRLVGTVPLQGSIFVAQPGVFGSGTAGHVAYVEEVTVDGMTGEITFVLSEWNAPTLGVTTTRTITISGSTPLVGVEFIS